MIERFVASTEASTSQSKLGSMLYEYVHIEYCSACGYQTDSSGKTAERTRGHLPRLFAASGTVRRRQAARHSAPTHANTVADAYCRDALARV